MRQRKASTRRATTWLIRTRQSGAGAQGRLATPWDQEQCTQVCYKEELWEAAQEEEMTIPWNKVSEES